MPISVSFLMFFCQINVEYLIFLTNVLQLLHCFYLFLGLLVVRSVDTNSPEPESFFLCILFSPVAGEGGWRDAPLLTLPLQGTAGCPGLRARARWGKGGVVLRNGAASSSGERGGRRHKAPLCSIAYGMGVAHWMSCRVLMCDWHHRQKQDIFFFFLPPVHRVPWNFTQGSIIVVQWWKLQFTWTFYVV